MKRKLSIGPRLAQIIRDQDGVFSRRQVEEHDGSREMLRRLVREGRWHRLAPTIYSDREQPSWRGRCWAGVLLGGPDAVLGGLAAGHVAGLWDEPDRISVWTGRRRVRVDGSWDFRRGIRAGTGELPRVDPVTALLEAAEDVAADATVDLVHQAARSRRLDLGRLRDRLEHDPRQRHRGLLLELAASAAGGIESPLELRYLRDVEQRHGLPVGRRQVSVSLGTRTDVAYEEFKALVELDGQLGHDGAGVFRDAQRDNRHLLKGLVTLRFGWRDVVANPCLVASMVGQVLRGRGWTGSAQRCPAC